MMKVNVSSLSERIQELSVSADWPLSFGWNSSTNLYSNDTTPYQKTILAELGVITSVGRSTFAPITP